VLRILRRPGNAGVIALCAITVAILAYLVASARSTTYSAEALGVVHQSSSLTPDQANRLAVTYASLIPKDAAIRRRVAAAVETTPGEVGRRLSVFNDSTTALLRIDYRGTSADDALAGARATLRSLAGPNPTSANIAPGSIGVVQLPTRASGSKNVKSSVVVGVLLGLGLGALLVIALQRGDPRIEDTDELTAQLGCPASAFEPLSDIGARALVERWRVLAGRPGLQVVALLPVREGMEEQLRDVALRLADAEESVEPLALAPGAHPEESLDDFGRATSTNGGSQRPGPARQLVLVAGHVPGDESGGEALAMMCDLTVLVVPQGLRRSEIEAAVGVLEKFGARPAWVIMVGARAERRAVDSIPASLPAAGSREPNVR
jgi:capsular polysaccharide biosynthesis protein